ncbi:hypothetical protein C9J21_20595 [Photobacterium phosphoreum]|uniref:hypothetical protein n=1 Tax=Photobacterium phosphoreum TaxID=659 RepID=UPI000D15DC26|nr:hypothetical protein [Photobacterium phosphoreum]PSW28395.1 hypothetical protein C9J21_20595 [Photobacterium phosphoreum]
MENEQNEEILTIYYQPCRLPAFKKNGRWVIATTLFFLLSAVIFHEFLEYNHLIPTKYFLLNHENDNGWWLVFFGGTIPYMLYQWRYTVPDDLFTYERDYQGNRHLNFTGHILASLLTMVLFVFCLTILGMPF